MIRIIIALFALVGFFRALSFACWNKKEGNVQAFIGIIVLSVISAVFCVVNLLFE